MPLEYFIEELTLFGKITHSSTFSAVEAGKSAIKLSRRTKNPITVTTHIIPANQIEDIDELFDTQISMQKLFEEIYGENENFSELNPITQLFLQILTETANEVMAHHKFGILTVERESKEDEI